MGKIVHRKARSPKLSEQVLRLKVSLGTHRFQLSLPMSFDTHRKPSIITFVISAEPIFIRLLKFFEGCHRTPTYELRRFKQSILFSSRIWGKLVWDWLLFEMLVANTSPSTHREIYFEFDPPRNGKGKHLLKIHFVKRANSHLNRAGLGTSASIYLSLSPGQEGATLRELTLRL